MMSKYIILFVSMFLLSNVNASEGSDGTQKFDNAYIEHHMSNSGEWHPFPFVDIKFGKTIFFIGPIEIKLSLHLLMMLFAFSILVFLFVFYLKKDPSKVPGKFGLAVEALVLYIRDELIAPHMDEKEMRFFLPYFLTVFFFILLLNLLGLIPVFAPATANINVTAGLASITLVIMVAAGLRKHGLIGFFKLFLPPGVPKVMYVILFPLELMGLITKPLALTMRLFGNMLGGHIAISAIVSLVILFGYVGIPALGMGLLLDLIEVLAVFLQAMIFTMLSAIYIGSMLSNHH
ncbi:MAG: F0F1 ATP synthase subunit A [Fibrobacteres bacterium]|nr:F0F1 ATP synthase subunit A [Fibrobacterota bacterium]